MSTEKKYINRINTQIRFSEVDSMGVVWHGNYVKYLEDGREAFGSEYGLKYFDVYAHGLMTPVVKLDVDYKGMVRYGDEIIIETEFVPTKAAKIILKYKIFNAKDNKVVLTATTIQVFIDMEGQLQLTNPEFYEEWQEKLGINLD